MILGFVVGGQGPNEHMTKVQFEKAQMENKKLQQTLDEFRIGMVNCLFATAVVEEGLDIKVKWKLDEFGELDENLRRKNLMHL